MSKFIRNNKTISGRLLDEMVMMDIEKGKYFSLNPVATHIWDLIEKPMGIEELCAVLMEEYEVSHDQCLSEVREHLREMVRLGIVLETE